jgi:RNA polymerase sigma-70 factor (ECF subfamily)
MDDADLVRAARTGDREALDALMRRHRAAVVRACARLLRDRTEAEDAAQEALLQALVGLPRLRDPHRFAPWLHGIAVNVSRRALRRRRALEALLRGEGAWQPTWPPAAVSPEDALLERERRTALVAALADMPAPAREAIVAVDLGGASYHDAAARLAVPASTVRGRLHEGRKRLRARLEDERTTRPGPPAGAKEAAMEDLASMEVEVVGFGRRIGDPQVEPRRLVLLRERDGTRRVDVPVGPAGDDVEAALEGEPPAGLAAGLLDALGATVERVVLDAADAPDPADPPAWSATVVLGGGGPGVPARPGEAIALAAATGAPVACRPGALDRHAVDPTDRARRGKELAAEIAALRHRVGDREPPPAAPAPPLESAAAAAVDAELRALCDDVGAVRALLMHAGGTLVAWAGDVAVDAASRYARARAAGDGELADLAHLDAFDPDQGAIICFRQIGRAWRLEVGFADADESSPPRPDDERIEAASARLEALLGA